MKSLFAVTYVNGMVSIVKFASEDGERYQAPTKDWSKVAEPKRFVMSEKGFILSADKATCLAWMNQWSTVKGVWEYWTESKEVAEAVAQTVKLVSGLHTQNACRDCYM